VRQRVDIFSSYDEFHAGARVKITDEIALKWQAEFPILKKKIHAANCSQSPQSKRVRKAIHTYLDSWREFGMDWELWIEETYKAKQAFAKLIHAHPDEIAISTSASAATASIASALDPRGDRKKIVATEAEFPTVAHVWLGHQKYGFHVDFIPLTNGTIPSEAYENFVDKKTALASVTHVYYQNGFKQNLKKIAETVHQSGAYFFVDAYQSLGTCHVDVREMDVDILISGNLKYLLGIPGVAFIYVKKELVETLHPAVTGWFGQENPFAFDCSRLDFAKEGRRFDTGTPPIIAAYAARAGMEIINEVNPKHIEKRIQFLSELAIQKAQEYNLDYIGPDKVTNKGATTAIKVPKPHTVESLLKKRNIIASARGNVIRIAPHFFTTEDDIQKIMFKLKKVMKSL